MKSRKLQQWKMAGSYRLWDITTQEHHPATSVTSQAIFYGKSLSEALPG